LIVGSQSFQKNSNSTRRYRVSPPVGLI
jgi:hypothetical protein